MNTRYKCVVIGAGWGGIAAAVEIAKHNVDVILVERTDMILGTGLSGGIMRNNGRYTAAEELIEMGSAELFNICDKNSVHRNISFPGHNHASLYDIKCTYADVEKLLKKMGVHILYNTRVKDVIKEKNRLNAVITSENRLIEGIVFIDGTGTSGPISICTKYGNGCAMCVFKCPAFGPRVSLSEKFGIQEKYFRKKDGTMGAMSGSCKIMKDTLSSEIVNQLNSKGVAMIPLPDNLKSAATEKKVCQQYTMEEYTENIILLDIGSYAKMMASFYNLDFLRTVPGFENAVYSCPYAGGIGNSIRFTSMTPRHNTMKVKGVDNLFCCGERSGYFIGHTEAIISGTLAGYNAVRLVKNENLFTFPAASVIGDAFEYTYKIEMNKEEFNQQYTFSGAAYFERMLEKDLYTTDIGRIKANIKKLNLSNMFNRM